MTSIETPAGRLARIMPELGQRELSALMSENQHRELARASCAPTAAWLLSWMDAAERAIQVRAEDARALALAVALHGAGSNAYWAALP